MKDAITNTSTKTSTQLFFNPFPGLRPFSVDESHLFFGREGQSDEVIKKLDDNRFVGVIGASGSGKSSLMYCGVIPVLYGGFIAEAGSDWKIITSRPGSGPVDNLARAITLDSIEENITQEDLEVKSEITASVIRSSSLGLVEALKQIDRKNGENILLLVDQFEELFRYKKSSADSSGNNESSAFVKMLLEAVKQTEVPVYVVITMRSDFIGDCAQFPGLTKLINDSHYLIPQMTREDMKDAIVGPVAVGGGKITSQLVQQLLNDVGDNQDQLPILQHSLMRTWEYWASHKEGDEPMDVEHYEAIGKMEKALSMHANEAYDELNERQKEICESVFKTLTEKGADNRGIRHPTRVDDLAAIARCTEKEIIEVTGNFRKQGRSFLTPPTSSDIHKATIIDISHESLMRIWDRLKSWVEEESAAIQMYLRLSEAAALYQEGKTSLWRPPDLQLALNWRDKKKPTLKWAERYSPAFERAMVFLETSEKAFIIEEENKILQQKRALRRTRIFAIILGSATIISLGLMIWAVLQQAEAKKQTELAIENEKEAVKQKEFADIAREEAEKQKEVAEKARVIAEEKTLLAEEKTEEAIAAREESERQEKRAVRALAESERQRQLALLAQKEAEAQKAIAEQQKEAALIAEQNAQNLRMTAIAKSMAIKSVQITRDTNQKALVSYQAYKFNEEFNGKPYDPDIYDGLYYTVKALNPEEYNTLQGHQGAVRSVVYHDNDHLYTACSDGKIFSWNLNADSIAPTEIYDNGVNHINRSLAITSDGAHLAVTSEYDYVQLIDLKNENEVTKLEGHEKRVWAAQFTPDNKKLLTTGADNKLMLWDVSTKKGTVLDTLQDRINSIYISPDGREVAGATEMGDLIIWDLKSKNKTTFYHDKSPLTAVCYSANGKYLAAGDRSGQIRIWDLEKEAVFAELDGQSSRIKELKFDPTTNVLASASLDGSVLVWTLKDINEQPLVMKDHEDGVWSIAFSPDGQKIIAGCKDGHIRIWPTSMEGMAEQICGHDMLERNLSQKEWIRFVAEDIDYLTTCDDLPVGEGATLKQESTNE